MREYFFAFLVGGFVTTAITYFETKGWPLFSRLAALFPVFTWLSYIFIGRIAGPQAVSQHALFVLFGTIVAWIPYMLVIYYLAPRIGATQAILVGLLVFVLLAVAFILFWGQR